MEVAVMLSLLVAVANICLVSANDALSSPKPDGNWPTPSPAVKIQNQETMFRLAKAQECKGRYDICEFPASPCRDAADDLAQCRELCASIYRCTSFAFHKGKHCHLSSTCTEATMKPGRPSTSLYLKQPPPDPRYPALVTQDFGQVEKIGDHSCGSGEQVDGWTFIKECESHKVKKSNSAGEMVTLEGGGTAADCFNECAELDGCNYVTWEGQTPLSRVNATYSGFQGHPSLYSWDFVNRNSSSPGKLWKYCVSKGNTYSITLPPMPAHKHLRHSLAIIGKYDKVSVTGGYTQYTEVPYGTRPGQKVWNDQVDVWTDGECPTHWWKSQTEAKCDQTCADNSQARHADGRCKCGLGHPNQNCHAAFECKNHACHHKHPTATALRPASSKIITDSSPQKPIVITVTAHDNVSLQLMVDDSEQGFDFDLLRSNKGFGFTKSGSRKFGHGTSLGNMSVYTKIFTANPAVAFRVQRKMPYLLRHMPRNLGQNQNCHGHGTAAYIGPCVSRGSASACAQECGRQLNCKFITWRPDHSSYRRRFNSGLNYGPSSGGAWKGKGDGHMWKRCDTKDHTGTAVFGVTRSTTHTLVGKGATCSQNGKAMISACKTPTTAACLQECAEHPKCNFIQWRRLFLDAPKPQSAKWYPNIEQIDANNWRALGAMNKHVGDWGGSCTCPDGSTYFVGDYVGSGCSHLACVGGKSGKCQKTKGKWSGKKVNCGLEIPQPEKKGQHQYLLLRNVVSQSPNRTLHPQNSNLANTTTNGTGIRLDQKGSYVVWEEPEATPFVGLSWYYSDHQKPSLHDPSKCQEKHWMWWYKDWDCRMGHVARRRCIDGYILTPLRYSYYTCTKPLDPDGGEYFLSATNTPQAGNSVETQDWVPVCAKVTMTATKNGRYDAVCEALDHSYNGESYKYWMLEFRSHLKSNKAPLIGCLTVNPKFVNNCNLRSCTPKHDATHDASKCVENGQRDWDCCSKKEDASCADGYIKTHTTSCSGPYYRFLCTSPDDVTCIAKSRWQDPPQTSSRDVHDDAHDQRDGYGVGEMYSSCDKMESCGVASGRCKDVITWFRRGGLMFGSTASWLHKYHKYGLTEFSTDVDIQWYLYEMEPWNRCPKPCTGSRQVRRSAGSAYDVYKVEKCTANVKSSMSCYPAPQLPPARYIKLTAAPGMDISHIQVACEDLNHKRVPLKQITPEPSYTEYIESGLKSYMDCRDIVCRAHNCKDFIWDQWTLKCTVFNEVLRGTKLYVVSGEADSPKNLSRVIIYNMPEGSSAEKLTSAACSQQNILNATLSIATSNTARNMLDTAQWNEVDMFQGEVAQTYIFEACKSQAPTTPQVSGVLHHVSSCTRCGINFCKNYMRVAPETSNTYSQVGPEVEAWGCDKVDHNSPRVKFGHHVYVVDDGIYSPAQINIQTPAPTPATPAPSPEKYHIGILGENACDYGDSVVSEQCRAAAFAALPKDRTATTDDITRHPNWSVVPPRGYQKFHTAKMSSAPPGCSIRYLPGELKQTSGAQQWDALWNSNNFGVNDGNWTSVCTQSWSNTVEPTATPTTAAPIMNTTIVQESYLDASLEVEELYV